MKIEENYSLLPHNTFHLQANARFFIEYNSVGELVEVLALPWIKEYPVFHIGGGSNLLFKGDYKGVILHSSVKGMEKIGEDEESVLVKVGSGEVWDDVVAFTVEAGWYGAENLSLIPGETGAAAVQNIGAYGIELKDIVDSVEAVERSTGKIRIFNNAECEYAYRESIFKKELKDQYIITHVVLRLQKKQQFHLEYGNIQSELAKYDTVTLTNVRQTIIAIRESKLPDTDKLGNAGSFFMNPYVALPKYLNLKQEYPQMPHYPVSDDLVKVPAAWLIEQCGWKGREWGGAGVHDKQCLVLVNRGGALASDIVDLAANIQTSVKEKFDIDITPEVIYI
ncbi:UDP-N-acetylmuramate dehydrogenase [Parabacteroides sp. FAFU027]|uniref:UDP-N-acetylmuramate dehydrogenase n=1 Tax=Parabacteroides sp. FAFU027 TaxID=2922715 RepID=UPI001FAEE6DA|nr:UDP-N-acetylmuramate dehydrogenase [Parabacteroides sp. FAFU027]